MIVTGVVLSNASLDIAFHDIRIYFIITINILNKNINLNDIFSSCVFITILDTFTGEKKSLKLSTNYIQQF
jgi:two-component SAPR family response regulator